MLSCAMRKNLLYCPNFQKGGEMMRIDGQPRYNNIEIPKDKITAELQSAGFQILKILEIFNHIESNSLNHDNYFILSQLFIQNYFQQYYTVSMCFSLNSQKNVISAEINLEPQN